MEERIAEVEWESIRVSPFQPRRLFAQSELQELADSIQAIGLVHPPIVRAIYHREKLLYYELIAGERRWRAAKLAGLSKIKVIVREVSDSEAAQATLIENVQRVDLNPIETALALGRLVEVFSLTQEEVAQKVGKKRSTVANYLRLLALPPAIQEAIGSGIITMGHAKAILSLVDPDLQKLLQESIVRNQLSVREAETESRSLAKRQKEKRRGNRARDPHIILLEEKLQERFGTKVSIHASAKKGGTISLRYYHLDDLSRLLERLGMDTSIDMTPSHLL